MSKIMKIKFNNHIYNIQSKIQNSELSAVINNQSVNYQVEKIDDNISYLWIEGIKYKAHVSTDKKSIYVWIDGNSFKFELIDEEHSDADDTQENLNRQEVTAPMPGNIVKVMVKLDQEIGEATPLLIVEAMKMETTLYSQISGFVKEINCKEKEQVDSDKVLIVIEK